MKDFIKDYGSMIFIVVVLSLGYIGFNKLITTQAEHRAIYEATREDIKKNREIYERESELLKKALESQDSIIKNYEKELKYIRNQNDAIYNQYKSLPDVILPNL